MGVPGDSESGKNPLMPKAASPTEILRLRGRQGREDRDEADRGHGRTAPAKLRPRGSGASARRSAIVCATS